MIDYTLILRQKYPGEEWTLVGDDYDGLIWHSNSPKPTKEHLDSLWESVHLDNANERIKRQRQAAYAIEVDPLFFKWQRGESTEQEWLSAVQRVKNRYPYDPSYDEAAE